MKRNSALSRSDNVEVSESGHVVIGVRIVQCHHAIMDNCEHVVQANRGLTVGSVFSKPRPPLRKPPITSRTVQAKRTRKSSTQQCPSDSEHFCSGQVRLQIARCVSQCPRSSRWASSNSARNSTKGSGCERASESPPRSTPNQSKQEMQIATAKTVRGVELGAKTTRTRKRLETKVLTKTRLFTWKPTSFFVR